jgi:hypothetical protein
MSPEDIEDARNQLTTLLATLDEAIDEGRLTEYLNALFAAYVRARQTLTHE